MKVIPVRSIRSSENLFTKMVESWRDAWGQGEFPFYYVQLPNLNRDWMQYRQLQLDLLDSIPESGMAVTIDLGDPVNVHPRHKKTVAERLSKWALAKAYGRKIVIRDLFIKDDRGRERIRIAFEHTGAAWPPQTIMPFEDLRLPGPIGRWRKAEAQIDGADLLLSSAFVQRPERVRYSWAPNPDGNLINREGLPASPFEASKILPPGEPAKPEIAKGIPVYRNIFNSTMREGVACYANSLSARRSMGSSRSLRRARFFLQGSAFESKYQHRDAPKRRSRGDLVRDRNRGR
jgi:hypothetical protein